MRKVTLVFLILLFPIFIFSVNANLYILVDTSRSLRNSDLKIIRDGIAASMEGLPSDTSVALYTFNDKPQEVLALTSGKNEVRSSLNKIVLGGRFTLLYDTIFDIVQKIGKNGGVILLFTDGVDEGSSITLEDAAEKAMDSHVSIAGFPVGEKRNENALRRLCKLTGGQILIDLDGKPVAPQKVIPSLLESSKTDEPVPKEKEKVSPKPEPQPPQPNQVNGRFSILIFLAMAILIILIIVAGTYFYMLSRSRRRRCENCGTTLREWELECPKCKMEELQLASEKSEMETPEEAVDIDPALLKKAPTEEQLERTFVIQETPILIQQKGKAPSRIYVLSSDKAFSIGRGSVNTLKIDDITLSSQHCKIIPKDDKYFLVDLKSTNGTFVDGQRITLKQLKQGSAIRIGQTEFIFKMEQRRAT